ncbi:MAG: hypothetical protein ABI596_10605 [Pyrinomonadaceae bacterium]
MTDYLWDRSGELDEDIQKLEEILAPLAYQPRPLELPATAQPGRRRNLYPVLAIAAAVALAALALGIWLNINRDASGVPQKAEATITAAVEKKDSPEIVDLPLKPNEDPKAGSHPNPRPVHRGTSPVRNQLALNRRHDRKTLEPQTEMSAAAALEAEAGKEQLLLALRLASSKLSLAVKRAQGGYPANLIRNQHKVG